MKILFVLSVFVALEGSAFAQLSDLRYSREPLPGLAEISEVGIAVDMGSAHDLMLSREIMNTLQPRLETLGYQVAWAPTSLSDGLGLQIDCHGLQEKFNDQSPRDSGQAASTVRRLSPPCQLFYRYQQERVSWRNVDRFIYSESVAAMRQILQTTPSLKPQKCVKAFFRLYDFPVLLAAEWGHVDRLFHLLKQADTSVSRQRLILTLLGETQVEKAFPLLIEKLEDRRVAREAANALGFFGLRAQTYLLPVLQDGSNPLLQAAAAKGLGRIAAASGNSEQTPLFMKMVVDPSVDIRVRTQLVWALGKAPDMRSYSTLLQLEQNIWHDYSHDPYLQEFREAVDWSIREVKQGGYGDDF